MLPSAVCRKYLIHSAVIKDLVSFYPHRHQSPLTVNYKINLISRHTSK